MPRDKESRKLQTFGIRNGLLKPLAKAERPCTDTKWPRPFKGAFSMTSEQRSLHSKPYKRCTRKPAIQSSLCAEKGAVGLV